MIPGSLPRRYARALFDLVQEEDAVESTSAALESLAQLLGKNRAALELLGDQAHGVTQRIAVIEEIAQRLKLSSTLTRFLSLLVKKERALLLPEIVREFGRLSDEALGILRVTVTAPTTPEEKVLRKVEGLLSARGGKKVIASAQTDPEMIGGLSLEMAINHTVYDGSVRRDLARIREKMMLE